MSNSLDVVGHELAEAVRLLEAAGERVAGMVRIERSAARQEQEREVVVRQRRDDDGGVELVVCHPRAVPTESESAQDG